LYDNSYKNGEDVKFSMSNPNIWRTRTVWLVWWLGHELEDLGLESRRGIEIFLFSKSSSPLQGPTQSLIQWVLQQHDIRERCQWYGVMPWQMENI